LSDKEAKLLGEQGLAAKIETNNKTSKKYLIVNPYAEEAPEDMKAFKDARDRIAKSA